MSIHNDYQIELVSIQLIDKKKQAKTTTHIKRRDLVKRQFDCRNLS